MIVGVWAYGIICWLEARKEIGKSLGQAGETTETAEKIKARKKAAGVKLRKKLLQDTGMCLAGYLTALLVLFGYIQIRYGMDEYVKGILRLFSMTEVATDYTAASMIMGMFDWYFQNLYWEIRMCVFLVVGIVAVGVLELIGSYVRKDTVTKVLRILEWAPGLLCQRIYELRCHYLARSDVFDIDSAGDPVADLYALRTEGRKADQRTDLPDRMDHFPGQ